MRKRRVLFVQEGCPHCRRAEEALINAKIDFERVPVTERSVVQLLSGQPSVPILAEVLGGESQDDDIISAIPRMQNETKP